MEAAETLSHFYNARNIFRLYSLLNLTAYLYPEQLNIQDGKEFDIIIVGAGSGGCVMANRLTEDPNVSVLLIEAGGDPPVESNIAGLYPYGLRTQNDWNYTIPQCFDNCLADNVERLPRGKMLGGSSSNNYMYYVRGDPFDYNKWANITNDKTWSYKNVLPYFMKSERMEDPDILNSPYRIFHGERGYMGVTRLNNIEMQKYLDAFEELGHKTVLDTNGDDTLGFAEPQVTLANDIRQSTANSFLTPAKTRPNLYVLKHHLVTKINFEDKRAVSVNALSDEGETITLKATKEIILSAGGINSPQLLMLSGVGPKEHLDSLGIEVIADLPVGQNLQDHKIVILFHATGPAAEPKAANPYLYPDVDIQGFVALDKNQTHPDYQAIQIFANPDDTLIGCLILFSFDKNICQKFYDQMKNREVMTTVLAPLHPKSRGSIKLKSTNPEEYPEINSRAYTEETDLEDVLKFMTDHNRIINTTYFQSVDAELLVLEKCSSLEVGSEDYMRCYARCMVTTIYHYVGTCAMGSVVDSQLSVLGVNNLRVVDGSVMPVITSGNANAPIIMIAEKAADLVKRSHGMIM